MPEAEIFQRVSAACAIPRAQVASVAELLDEGGTVQASPARPAKRGNPPAVFRLRRGWRRYGGREQILFWMSQFIRHRREMLAQLRQGDAAEKD
jgi:hypothetical protein